MKIWPPPLSGTAHGVDELVDDLAGIARIEVAIQQRHLIAGTAAHDHDSSNAATQRHRAIAASRAVPRALRPSSNASSVAMDVAFAGMVAASFASLLLLWLI